MRRKSSVERTLAITVHRIASRADHRSIPPMIELRPRFPSLGASLMDFNGRSIDHVSMNFLNISFLSFLRIIYCPVAHFYELQIIEKKKFDLVTLNSTFQIFDFSIFTFETRFLRQSIHNFRL